MEVVVPVQDFHFDNASTNSYASAPSSPKITGGDPFNLFRHYTSAPTSPARAASIYAHINSIASGGDSFPPSPAAAAAAVPFYWEKSGTPKEEDEDAVEFVFDFSGHLNKEGLPVLTDADELFKEGMIRPLNSPPRQQFPAVDDRSSVASSPRGMWSPGRRGRGRARDEFDGPFAAATVESPRDRGREKTSALSSFSSPRSQKSSRSLSPLRGGGSFFKTTPNYSETSTILKNGNASGSDGGSKKWRLKNFLLFHSASEWRVTGNQSKDPLRQYTLLSSTSSKKVDAKDLKNSSFRSAESSGSGSMRRGSGHTASSHEKHYAANRAASEDLKKKTALPYRQSLFGCLRFNPAVHSIGRAFNSKSFGRR